MSNTDDWRIRGQEDYLTGVPLIHKRFKSKLPKVLMPDDDPRKYSDHEHCDFCWHKFMEDCKDKDNCSTDGYCTLDERIWICEECFKDFKEKFRWTVIDDLVDKD
ncbi:hypothetical protein LJC58_09485 [Lachnospiraceae bacterium OttesenSCG-928-D06]|nr:hypothetical protein [Lachnospiraceae bacterium OttesenSCG-928-D06]